MASRKTERPIRISVAGRVFISNPTFTQEADDMDLVVDGMPKPK